MKHLPTLFIIFAVAITVITRFVNLAWGQPFFFHPDERNIASSISQLQIPTNINPHFFAYGSLPIYLMFFVGITLNFFFSCHFSFTSCTVGFEQAILLSRILSGLFSCLSLIILYKLAYQLWNKQYAYFVLFLGIFCTGFIQFSHFGTYEMWSVFFSLLLCYVLLKNFHHFSLRNSLGIGVITGTLIALKLSNIVYLPLTLLCLGITCYKAFHGTKLLLSIRKFFKHTILILITTFFIYIVTNPFVLLSPKEFLDSFQYEKTVATGELPVFYTQEFLNTIPIVYQFIHVLPFLINPVITFLIPLILIGSAVVLYRSKKIVYGVIVLFFFISFVPQAVLFIKWTRNSVITIPFILLLVPTLFVFVPKKRLKQILMSVVMLVSIFFSLSYFTLVFLQPDSRITAANEAKKYIPSDAKIMSEVYDLGIVPFNGTYDSIILVNTYDMESDGIYRDEFISTKQNAEYIILPSQRVLKTRLKYPTRFPVGSAFYTSLQNKQAYKKIYETPCQFLCQIVYLGDPISRFETTTSVFDRPVVTIYKKL